MSVAKRNPAPRRMILTIIVALSLFVPLVAVFPTHTGRAMDDARAFPGLVVSEHNPQTVPEDFYVPHPETGELRPYIFIDESTPSAQHFRVRILASTKVGYQDFIFDGPSGSMSIHSGEQVILERFDVRTEGMSLNGRGQGPRSSRSGNARPFNFVLHDDLVEITHHQQINPAISRTTTFRIGFDGQNPVHQVTTELHMPGNGNAHGARLRTWFRLQGPPIEVSDKRVEQSAASEADGTVEPLELGELVAEWLSPSSGLVEQHSSADDTIELAPPETAIDATGKMIMNIGAETPSSSVTVTAQDQFELIFMSKKGGGIQYWYDLANDPDRTQNLVRKNGNLVAHRIQVGGDYYFTSKRGEMKIVEHDSAKVVVRQFGTYNDGSPSLDGTTYEIFYTIWASGQVGIELVNRTSVLRPIDAEERQLQVSNNAWQPFSQHGPINGFSTAHRDADYIGFALNGSSGAELNADVALAQRSDWSDSHLVFLRSNSGGYDMGWKSRTTETWAAGFSETVHYLLMLKPDTLNNFADPDPYVIDYRAPDLSVSGGNGTGFDFRSVSYGIEAGTDYVQFSLGNAVARFQPRFEISNWSSPSLSLSFSGEQLTAGVDYLVNYDSETHTLRIVYLGVIPSGSVGAFTLMTDTFLPAITSFSPPVELTVMDESGGFAIPYIQESTTLDVAAEVDDLPPGGGIEFVIDGQSTMDMSAPFNVSVPLAPGEHAVEAHIVNSAGQRLTNSEASAYRPQVGIGTITTTIGDSLTAGNNSDSWDSPIVECEQSPYASPDCRNFFQHSASSGVWYAGYQIEANRCLADATGASQFLMNDGYGGITSQGVLSRMNVYTEHIAALGASQVFLLIGTNDGNQLVPVDEWQANVEAIIANLVSAGIDPSDIYLGHVPYRLGGGVRAQERRERMQEYNAQLPEIAANTGATVGPDLFTYYQNNQHLFSDNLHLTQEGYDAMGGLWAAAVTGSTDCVP